MNTTTGEDHTSSPDDPANISLAIWNRVEKTDPSFTTPMTGSFNGTAISPVYMLKKATEIFGPLGLGFGYEIVEEGFVDGSPMGFNAQGEPLGPQRVHILRLKFWYVWNGKRGEFEHFGQTPFIGLNYARDRVVTDGDVKKKSLTDALTKCLSLVGVCSDVHMGLHDDSKYVGALICEFGSAVPAPPSPSPAPSPAPSPSNSSFGSFSTPSPSPSVQPETTKTQTGRRGRNAVSQPSAATPPVSSPAPVASSDAQAGTDQPGHQAGLDLKQPAETASSPAEPSTASPQSPTPAPAPAAVTDVDKWVKRIKSLGTDAIGIAKTTVLSIFSGADLERVQAALTERERELSPTP